MALPQVIAPAVVRQVSASWYLPRSGFAAKLLHRLDHVVEAMDVAFGQEAAMGIERQRAVARDASALHEGAALAFLAEAQAFELHEDAVGEAVVDLGDVDVLRPHAGAAPEIVGDVFGVVVRMVRPADGIEQVLALIRAAAIGAAR